MGIAVLNVIAVIGLVAVGAFIIVFLTDLLISIIDGKKGIFFKRNTKNKEEVKTLEMADELETSPKLIELKKEENQKLESNVDLELAESERLALVQANEKIATENEALKQRIDALEAKQSEDLEEELTDEELDKMYEDLIADLNKEDEEEDEDLDIFLPQENEEDYDKSDFEVKEDEKLKESEQAIDEERLALEQEIEELRNQLEKEQQEKVKLAKQLEETETIVQEVETVEGDTLEALLEKKAELEERLKNANKELKLNKKEYIPLARIKKTLESDEAKLRRREAIVAKKKIMLFGVTNYVVDPEKEKELSEDLDQLEALRLSVQHCEEVMQENKDRYPLLENTNKILTITVSHIKSDLEAVEQKIAKLTADQGDNNE